MSGTVITKLLAGILGVALASSGLAYAGVPVPNPADAVVQAFSGGDVEPADADTREEAEAGQQTAAEKREAAASYTGAVKDWAACVREAASARGDEEEHEGPFDPFEACGDRPNPHDHGLSSLPSQASERAGEAREQADQRREEGRSRGAEQREAGEANRQDDGDGPPEGTPQGKPDEAPDGKPDEAPDGKPGNTPGGRP